MAADLNGDSMSVVNSIFHLVKDIQKSVAHGACEKDISVIQGFPVDVLDTPEEYIFYVNVPGFSKSDIQVTVEEENKLVIICGGKKKEDGMDEGRKYLMLERKPLHNMGRRFKLPKDIDASAISAKCENGVLTVLVGKLGSQKAKTVQVTIT